MTPNWSREFEDPIIIPPRGPRGKSRELVTLKDAGEFIAKLPKTEHTATEWQTAMESRAKDGLVPDVPASGYALEVDGRFKAEFTTRTGLGGSGGMKKRFRCFRCGFMTLCYKGSRGSPASTSMSFLQTSLSAHAAVAAPGSREPSRAASRPSGFDPLRTIMCRSPEALARGPRRYCMLASLSLSRVRDVSQEMTHLCVIGGDGKMARGCSGPSFGGPTVALFTA